MKQTNAANDGDATHAIDDELVKAVADAENIDEDKLHDNLEIIQEIESEKITEMRDLDDVWATDLDEKVILGGQEIMGNQIIHTELKDKVDLETPGNDEDDAMLRAIVRCHDDQARDDTRYTDDEMYAENIVLATRNTDTVSFDVFVEELGKYANNISDDVLANILDELRDEHAMVRGYTGEYSNHEEYSVRTYPIRDSSEWLGEVTEILDEHDPRLHEEAALHYLAAYCTATQRAHGVEHTNITEPSLTVVDSL